MSLCQVIMVYLVIQKPFKHVLKSHGTAKVTDLQQFKKNGNIA